MRFRIEYTMKGRCTYAHTVIAKTEKLAIEKSEKLVLLYYSSQNPKISKVNGRYL